MNRKDASATRKEYRYQMTDPYKVLGLSRNASDEDVKKAHRELARKYHPDNYHENPLADLAQEKMKEVNEAYDAITKQRGGTAGGPVGSGPHHRGYGGHGGKSYTGPYAQIRMAIQSGNLDLAERLLSEATDHNAEWYFLMGSLYYRRGWLDQARQYFNRAVNMEPSNPEYRMAAAQMNAGGFTWRGGATPARSPGLCECCTALYCMSCMCR